MYPEERKAGGGRSKGVVCWYFILYLSYYMCIVYVCMCAWGGARVQLCIWCCMPEANLRCLLQLLSTLVFEMGVSLNDLEFTDLLDWWASKPQYPLVSVPQN